MCDVYTQLDGQPPPAVETLLWARSSVEMIQVARDRLNDRTSPNAQSLKDFGRTFRVARYLRVERIILGKLSY